MGRCKHQDVTVCEQGIGASEYMIVNGEVVSDWASSGTPTGKYFFICDQCKRTFTFIIPSHRWPKWAQRAYKIMGDYSSL